ncbi:hypothetical protein [Psychrobacter celer]|uniref:hypothetical protein n=1 Tax=Psychrobacter celer TaxID=306572 RepID=UPI003FD2D4C6
MSKKWYIATNTENLTHFINYGLIIDKQGFTNSYLIDAMQDVPMGYIPCFAASSLFPALKKAKEEDKNLTCCLLELDIKQIAETISCGGLVQADNSIAYQQQNDIHELANSEGINCILLPAPLPLSLVEKVILKDAGAMKVIQSSYEKKHSAKTSFFKLQPNLFNEPKNRKDDDQQLLDKIESWELEPRKINYNQVFSYGGALGLLYYQTKNGRESTEIFEEFTRLILDNCNTTSANGTLKIIKPFKDYLLNSQIVGSDIDGLYKLIIDKLVTISNIGEARHFLLSTLNNIDMPEKYNSKCNSLAKRLEGIVEGTIELDAKTIFESIVNKAYADDIEFKIITLLITMFFLRGNVETMLKYYHADFSESHYSLLAIFFGITYGIVNIPNEIRQNYELSAWLSYKMAEYAHHIDGNSTINFKEPEKPKLIYDNFIKTKITRNYKLQNFYHWLSMEFYKREDGKEQNLVKWGVPLEGNIEKGGSLTSYSRPQIAATIEVEILEKYIRKKIEEDTLFDSNEITLAYKKHTK